MKSYIYVFKDATKPLIKIGKSNEPHKRLTTLNASHKFLPLESFVIQIDNESAAYRYEKALHNLFEDDRNIQHGEGGTEFFNSSILPEVVQVSEVIANNNNSKVDTDYFKRFYLGVLNPIIETKECNTITQTFINIGLKCRSLRLNKNIKQEDLAQACLLSVGTIKSAEQGKVKLENLVKILSVLGDTSFEEAFEHIAPADNRRSCGRFEI